MLEVKTMEVNNQKRINALIKLLDDSDYRIVEQISNQLILIGKEITTR